VKSLLLFGLGNPGREYEATRHNIGFRLADALSRHCRIGLSESARVAVWGQGTWRGQGLVIVKPLTFMNRSGRAVGEILRRLAAPLETVLVACDDVNLPLGELRLRPRGSSGGHRGLQSIIDELGTDEFARLRLGVGGAPAEMPLEDYVLEAFAPEERERVEELVVRARDAVLCLFEESIEVAMSRFNRRLMGDPQEEPKGLTE